MNPYIGFILCAGEGRRSIIEGVSINKGNYPLPDGTTPISRIVSQLAEGGIEKVFIVIKQTTPDFESLKRAVTNIPIELVDDCGGAPYPILSLSKAFAKLEIAPNAECLVSVSDVLFDESVSDLIAHPLLDKELALGWHKNRFTGCFKASFVTLYRMCQQNAKIAKSDQLIAHCESLGGFVSRLDVGSIHVGSVEEYARYMISELATTNPYLTSL